MAFMLYWDWQISLPSKSIGSTRLEWGRALLCPGHLEHLLSGGWWIYNDAAGPVLHADASTWSSCAGAEDYTPALPLALAGAAIPSEESMVGSILSLLPPGQEEHLLLHMA